MTSSTVGDARRRLCDDVSQYGLDPDLAHLRVLSRGGRDRSAPASVRPAVANRGTYVGLPSGRPR